MYCKEKSKVHQIASNKDRVRQFISNKIWKHGAIIGDHCTPSHSVTHCTRKIVIVDGSTLIFDTLSIISVGCLALLLSPRRLSEFLYGYIVYSSSRCLPLPFMSSVFIVVLGTSNLFFPADMTHRSSFLFLIISIGNLLILARVKISSF